MAANEQKFVYPAFHDVDVTAFSAQPPRTVGKGKMMYLDYNAGNNGRRMMKFTSPMMKQQWPVRPSDDRNEKFTLECSLGSECEPFVKAMEAFDLHIRRTLFKSKKDVFGKRADDMDTENDLRQLQNKSIKKGGVSATGNAYDDTVRFKIEGWADYLDEVVYNEAKGDAKKVDDDKKGDDKKEDKGLPKYCTWKPRVVEGDNRNGPKDNETHFYLKMDKNMYTNSDRYNSRVPMVDAAGEEIKDTNGNRVYEFVGPKHCKPGCKLTVAFSASTVWLSDGKFGVKLAAREVYITPPPPQVKGYIEGIEVVSFVDPIVALNAVKLISAPVDESADAEAEPEADEQPEEPAAAAAEPAVPSAPAAEPAPAMASSIQALAEPAAAAPTPSKKRPASDDEPKATKGSKKSKIVTVSEDF